MLRTGLSNLPPTGWMPHMLVMPTPCLVMGGSCNMSHDDTVMMQVWYRWLKTCYYRQNQNNTTQQFIRRQAEKKGQGVPRQTTFFLPVKYFDNSRCIDSTLIQQWGKTLNYCIIWLYYKCYKYFTFNYMIAIKIQGQKPPCMRNKHHKI